MAEPQQIYATFMLAKGNGGYRDPGGRTAVHQLPWGWFEIGEKVHLSTFGPTVLGGSRGELPTQKTKAERMVEAGFDRVFVEFTDEQYTFTDPVHKKVTLHQFSEV